MMRVRALAAAAIAVGVLMFGAPAQAGGYNINVMIVDYVRADADYILAQQEPDGGIRLAPRYMGPPPSNSNVSLAEIHPYFSNIAARGLARATSVLRDSKYAAGTLKWLRWYIAHMDANGYVLDHCIKATAPSEWRSGSVCRGVPYDSTDSYAATFVSAMHEWWSVTGDHATLATLRDGLRKGINAIRSTTQPNGLTWATPQYPVMYLMDNVEVYEALTAAEPMLQQLGETALASTVQTQRSQIQAVFGAAFRLTDAGGNFLGYSPAYHPSGARDPICWRRFYPDAMAQAWPAGTGLGTAADNQAVIAKLDLQQPMWDAWMRPATQQPQPADACDDGAMGSIGFVPRLALGFSASGTYERTKRALMQFEADATAINRLYPFTTRAAGELIRLAAALYRPPLQLPSRFGRLARDWVLFGTGRDLCSYAVSYQTQRTCDQILRSL